MNFADAVTALTGNPPFPWQAALYDRFAAGEFPESCILPTGLGKTSVIAVWLIALANQKPVPRRLVYVVNRRTVVDQTTTEVEKYKSKKVEGIPDFAISTLRGQFADNREWSADPSRPAVICGTVDMIGSRLLFSGYGIGFKQKPLHAGFLGQDALLVHDEAHLEPAFQDLLTAIKNEQLRCKEFRPFHVMELTATSRGGGNTFELTANEQAIPSDWATRPDEPIRYVWQRLKSKKGLAFLPASRADVAKTIGQTARDKWSSSGKAVLVFVRSIEDVKSVISTLTDKRNGGVERDCVQTLTGTLRGLERDRMADPRKESGCPVFARFLTPPRENAPESEKWKVTPTGGTVYLVCTSAGEVGVDISADHMVCDLTSLDSMAQRFGRVNRRGEGAAEIDVVFETDPDPKKKDEARWHTKSILERLEACEWIADRREAGPAALGVVMKSLSEQERKSAFAPEPVILPTSDILFDAWALTTIRGKLPGRPMVEPYLHGLPTEWQPPETHVAWREEVSELNPEYSSDEERSKNEAADRRALAKFAEELLDDYPLKPHELLRDVSSRVYIRLDKLKADDAVPVWLVADDATVTVTTLGELRAEGKEFIEQKTVLLPPSAGGLEGGMLVSDSNKPADDVSDQVFDSKGNKRRVRLWDDEKPPVKMRLIRKPIDTKPNRDDEDEETDSGHRFWKWYELIDAGDSDGSKSNLLPVAWAVHVNDVVKAATEIASRLPLSNDLRQSLDLAARLHDHGKRRRKFQFVLGNLKNTEPLRAKSGRRGGRLDEPYRHEFGSLLDAANDAAFKELTDDEKDLVLHLIAVHHGYGRPHFPKEQAFDLEPPAGSDPAALAAEVPRRFARLQRKYGRWGLAYLESLLRAADWSASANPSEYLQEDQS
jgi:CRISPR-associated endonuclease/helicase Cas3